MKVKNTQSTGVSKSAVIVTVLLVVITLIVAGVVIACTIAGNDQTNISEQQEIDYTEEAFEDALNAEKDVVGKIVKFKVASVHPDSFCGYNLWSGVHLNFCSAEDIGAVEGQELVVKVVSVKNTLGSYIISYELINE